MSGIALSKVLLANDNQLFDDGGLCYWHMVAVIHYTLAINLLHPTKPFFFFIHRLLFQPP